MCGIAGLIHRGKSGEIGQEMTAMLQSLRHRGPDSTGFALYGSGNGTASSYVMRFKTAEQEDMKHGFQIHEQVKERRAEVDRRMAELGAKVDQADAATDYAFRYHFSYDGELRRLVDYIEDVEGAEILSVGKGLELIKDLGDAGAVSSQYALGDFKGTHGIGHTRMATESGCRYPLGASLLGLPFRRRLGRPQRPADQLLEWQAGAGTARSSLHVELR